MNIINFIKCFFCGQQLPAIDSNVSSIFFFDNCWLFMAIADQDRNDYWPRSSLPLSPPLELPPLSGSVPVPGSEGSVEGSVDGVLPLFLAAARSTVSDPIFSALTVAAWATRLATRLNSARPMRFSKSTPGVKMMLTPVMFLEVNFSQLSAPTLERETQKSPSSSSNTFLPSSSSSTRQLQVSESTPFTCPRL